MIIKFRAWNPESGEMLQVDGIQIAPNSPLPKPNIIDEHNDHHDLDKVLVWQFTGLKDAEGLDIYNGDIIESQRPNHLGRERHVIGFVPEWASFACHNVSDLRGFYDPTKAIYSAMRFDQAWIYDFNKTVIGNIYQNPNLLNGYGEESKALPPKWDRLML